jgi:hypothetical protein
MSAWLIAFVGVIYLVVCLHQIHDDNYPMAVVYFGYALANVGLYFLAK